MDITIRSFCPNEKHQIHIIQKFLQKIPGHLNMLLFLQGMIGMVFHSRLKNGHNNSVFLSK